MVVIHFPTESPTQRLNKNSNDDDNDDDDDVNEDDDERGRHDKHNNKDYYHPLIGKYSYHFRFQMV